MKLLKTLLLVIAATATLAAAADKPNYSGDWTLNIAKSTFGPYPAPASFTRKIAHADPSLTIVDEVKGGVGGDEFSTRNYTIGGKKIGYDTQGLSITSGAAWDGDVIAFSADGVVQDAGGITFSFTERYSLSSDGKTLTQVVHVDVPEPVGSFTLNYIFDKR